MNRKKNSEIKNPDKISSYFRQEKPVLFIITVTGLLYNIGMAAGPYFEGQMAQCLYDIIKGLAQPSAMLYLAAVYLAVILCVQTSRALKRFYVRIFANDVSRSMRRVLYNSLVHMNSKQLGSENLGSLMTKAIADVDACSEGMRKFTTEIFDTGVVMVVYLVMLSVLDWKLTILALLFTPAAYIIAELLKKQVTSANAAYKESASLLNQMTMDRVSNSITYRLFGRENNRNEAYEERLADYELKSAKANIFEGSLTPIYDAVSMIGAVVILYIGSRNIMGCGFTYWDIASFTTFLACFAKLAAKTSHAAKLFNAVQKARVSWNRISPLMKPLSEDQPLPDQIEPVCLSFDKVYCGYNEDTVLNDITFKAQPGEIIGITGQVASGKSMLGKVLLGEVPFEGNIFLGSRDFAVLTDDERHSFISYMGHEPELMSMSIAENIALGDDADTDKWLKSVNLYDEVNLMPEKADTAVGANAARLSGGQQARLALARTLAHARSVIILDDPLSAVDKGSESLILENIRKAMPDRVILLISHRLYHFPEMDHILFLHDGTADYSDHESLMRNSQAYAALYNKQLH